MSNRSFVFDRFCPFWWPGSRISQLYTLTSAPSITRGWPTCNGSVDIGFDHFLPLLYHPAYVGSALCTPRNPLYSVPPLHTNPPIHTRTYTPTHPMLYSVASHACRVPIGAFQSGCRTRFTSLDSGLISASRRQARRLQGINQGVRGAVRSRLGGQVRQLSELLHDF